MDELVKQALKKWPNVPYCYGWLGLDARGNWWMRDERTQACGTFTSGAAHSRGSLLKHEKLIEFIHRNYLADEKGRWYFQNGPQRVYVELESTPYIWRITPFEGQKPSLYAHTGHSAGAVQQVWVDEKGLVYLQTTLGFGLLHSLDVPWVADGLAQGLWRLNDEALLRSEIAQKFNFVMSPLAGI